MRAYIGQAAPGRVFVAVVSAFSALVVWGSVTWGIGYSAQAGYCYAFGFFVVLMLFFELFRSSAGGGKND